MSNHLISMAYKRDLRTAMRKSVMVLLADKASDDGAGIYASKSTMAAELCCSKQTVIDTIKAFISEGLLVEIGQRRNANGYTVEYGINVPALAALSLVKYRNDQSSSFTGQRDLPVSDIDATSQAAGPKPSLNPSSEDKSSSDSGDDALKPEHVSEVWNELAAKLGKPIVRKMTKDRRASVRARIGGYTLDEFREVFGNIERSKFLREGRFCTFDWVMAPSNFQKVLEGNYNG